MPGSVTRPILSVIVLTVWPFAVFTSRMYMSWIGLWVAGSNSNAPRGLLNFTASSAAMSFCLSDVSPLVA